MKIEITKGVETLVTNFFSATPETDAKAGYPDGSGCWKYNDLGIYVDVEVARKLERERDEALEARNECERQFQQKNDEVIRLLCERDEAMEQLRKASVEANTLATSIQKAEYPDAKEFELLGSVAGVISQVDNMYAGVRQQRDEAQKNLKITQESWLKAKVERVEALRERDEARTELEMWRDGNIMHQMHRDELQSAERERDESKRELKLALEQWELCLEQLTKLKNEKTNA